MRILIVGVLMLFATAVAAQEFLPGFPPGTFGRNAHRGGTAAPAATGSILMVDGTSLVLQTDGTSTICMAGGC